MKGVIKNMKEQFLNLSGLTELVTYIKLCIAQHKMIIPRASFSLFPKTGDENNIYIDTSTNSIYRWNDSDKSFVLLARPPRNISISEGKNNGQITLKVDEIESNATVHGLKSAAFSNASSFATSAQGAKADSAVQSITIAPGTNNGTVKITVNGVTTDNIKVAGLGSAAFSDIAVFAPAKHTHSKSDVGLGNVDNTADIDKSVKYAGSSGSSNTVVYTALTNTDLNTLQTEGRWYYAGGGNTCTNIPVASAAFELYVGRNASGWRYQQFTVTSGEIYIRVFDSSNWGSWRKLAFTSDTVTAASSVPWSGITGKPSTFAPSSHNHTVSQISGFGTHVYDATISRTANTVLAAPNGKAGSASFRALVAADIPSITKSKITDFPSSLPASDVYAWAKASSKPSYSWGEITGKPSTYTPSSHTHNYAGSSSAGGSANSAVKLDTSAGSATQPVYFSGGKPVACSYTLGKSVPSNAVFTDTNTTYPISYRTIDNNFASKYRTQTKGNTSAGDYISTLRCETNLVPYAPQYGSGLGWGRGDTHGYLYMNYGSPQVYVGAGNADKLNWAKQLAFADHTHSYTEITNRPTLIKAVSKNGYWGMADHDGSDSNWIRTTTAGIIPYQSGGAGAGHCGIGTSSWYFSNAYIDTVNCVNASVSGHIDVGGYIQSSNLINTYFEYQSNRGSVDWRFGAATGTGDENFFGFYDAKTGKIPLALDGNFGNIYVGFNVGSYESPTAVGVYLGGQVAGNRAFIYNGDSYQGSIWIQTRLDGSWKWFSLGRVCSTALSDIRLKGDIRDTEVQDATKVIEAMQIRSFERKDSHKKYKIGFIADELEQLDPNLVDGGGEIDGHPNYKSVNNLQMLAYVVKSMQELNSKVNILEQENKQLKQKLNMCN